MGVNLFVSLIPASFLVLGILSFILSIFGDFHTFWQVGSFRSLAVGCITMGIKFFAEIWEIEKLNISESTLKIITLLCAANIGFAPILDVLFQTEEKSGFVIFALITCAGAVISTWKLITYLIHLRKKKNNKKQDEAKDEIIQK